MAVWYEARHPVGADRFFGDFDKLCTHLASAPLVGRARDDLRAGLRQYPVHPFMVYYDTDVAGRIVRVLDVVHASRNVPEPRFEPEDVDADD